MIRIARAKFRDSAGFRQLAQLSAVLYNGISNHRPRSWARSGNHDVGKQSMGVRAALGDALRVLYKLHGQLTGSPGRLCRLCQSITAVATQKPLIALSPSLQVRGPSYEPYLFLVRGLIPVEFDVEGLYETQDRRKNKSTTGKIVPPHLRSVCSRYLPLYRRSEIDYSPASTGSESSLTAGVPREEREAYEGDQ